MYLKSCAAAILVASSAFAQIDGPGFATELRSKYGPPLARETFTPRPGIEMVVDYTANGNVCRIQLPPIAPTSRDPRVSSPEGIDELLLELIPLSTRGKELGRFAAQAGVISVSFINYENVTIAVSANASGRTGVTVTFGKEPCRDSKQ